MTHTIYQFSQESGEGEFIVISERPRQEIVEEFLPPHGYDLDAIYTIEEDAAGLPCDRALTHDLC